jgi:hypothetical protein
MGLGFMPVEAKKVRNELKVREVNTIPSILSYHDMHQQKEIIFYGVEQDSLTNNYIFHYEPFYWHKSRSI